MPDFGSLYGVPGGAPVGGFDVLGPNAGAQQQGQSGAPGMSPQQAQQLLQLMQANGMQPQGGGAAQPYQGSGLMADILGLPQYGIPAQAGQQ